MTVETQEQPAKVYDIVNDKFVDNPLLNKPEEQETESEEESEETETEEKPAKKEKSTEKEEESEEEESEESKESEEEESEEPESEEKEEESEPEEEEESEEESDTDITTPDAFVSHFYGEKYGVKSQKELVAMLDASIDANAELETLRADQVQMKKDMETLRVEAGKPKFKSDKEQKAFEFLSQYDIDRQGEALDTFAKILGMDIDNTDGVILLEEKFVHEHPEWNRAEAQRMFRKEHARKYTLKRESFDGSDAEFEQEQQDLKIAEKGEIARAKTYLKDVKSKYKPAEKQAEAQTPEIVTKAIEKNAGDYTGYLGGLKELQFRDSDGDEYKFKLEANHKSQLSKAIDAWVKNPASYDDKGVLKGISSPNQMTETLAWSMFHDEMINALKSQMKNLVNTKRVDDVAKHQPKKRNAPAGKQASINGDDLDAQAMRLIKTGKHKAA